MVIRPVSGQTFNQCKALYWSCIETSRELIKALQASTIVDRGDASIVIAHERQYIKDTYAELKELQRWFNKEGKKWLDKQTTGKSVSHSKMTTQSGK